MRNWQLAVVVAGLVAIGGCSVDATERMVRDALVTSGIADVEVRAERGTIRLSGTVDTLADRTRAVELASVVAGKGVPVENDITVTGLGPLGADATESQPETGETRR